MDGIKRATQTLKKIVIPRDPVERWISGSRMLASLSIIIQMLDTTTFWQTVYKNPVYDDLTEYSQICKKCS